MWNYDNSDKITKDDILFHLFTKSLLGNYISIQKFILKNIFISSLEILENLY